MRAIRRSLNISPDEDKRVLVLALGWACITGFTISAKAARDAIFLSRYDRTYLPLMVVAIAVAVALAVPVCWKLSRVLKPYQFLAIAGPLVGASMWLVQTRLAGWTIPALYVWVEVATVIFGLQFWLLASDLVDSRQAKRLFGLVAGGGSLAAIAIGSQLKPFVKVHGAAGLLPLSAALCLAVGAIGFFAGRIPPAPQPPPRRQRAAGANRKADGYLISIAVVVCAAAIATTLVDYQFKIVAAKELRTEAELVVFFGMFSAAAGFSSLVFQFVLTGRILSRLGIVAGLALLPLGLGVSSVYLLLSPVLAAAALAKFSEQTLKFTVHNSGMECLWLPVPYARRQEVKPWITGTLKSSAEGFAGLATFFLAKVLPLSLLSLLVVGTCVVWVWTLARLKGAYSRALEAALRSRAIEDIGLQLDAQDPTVVATVDRSLTTGDPTEQLVTLELIRDMQLAPWTATLRNLLRTGTVEVRRKVLETAGDDARVLPDSLLLQSLDAEPPVAEVAIRAALHRGLKELVVRLEAWSADPHPGVRAVAARAFYQMGHEPEKQERLLKGMLNGSAQDQLAALRELAEMPRLLPDGALAGFLGSPSVHVREAVLEIAAARGSVDLIPLALDCLVDRETSMAARSALLRFPPEPVVEEIARRFAAETLAPEQRAAHVRLLRYLPPNKVYPLLCDQLVAEDPRVWLQAPDSLFVICRHAGPSAEMLKLLDTRRLDWVHSAYLASESLRLLPLNEPATLLRDHFQHAYLHRISGLLKLLAMRRPTVPVETCVQIIAAGDKSRLSFVLDLLDSFLPIAERKRVVPLFEPSEMARSEAGRRLFPNLPMGADEVVRASIQSKRDWEQAIGLDYAFREDPLIRRNRWTLACAGPLSAEVMSRVLGADTEIQFAFVPPVAAGAAGRNSFMYSTLEKTIVLKSATLFSAIAAETLSRVAQAAGEVSYPAGASVYREGDAGVALYVVASGAVRVTTGPIEFGVLRRGDPFGEVAVLNRDVYRADVTAVEDTVLLRIEQEDLFDLMQANSEIMLGIIGLLARRVVQVGDRLRDPERNGE